MNKPTIIFIVLLIFSNVFWGIWLYTHEPQIVYVRTPDLIEKYLGTLEARQAFEKKKNSLIANADSLSSEFERSKNNYLANMNKLSIAERKEMEQQLNFQQTQLVQYNQVIEAKIQEEDEKMMQGVLNQINSYVKKYGEERGYDVVLGTTASGSILFGNTDIDITDQLIVDLNKHYKGI